MEEITLTLKIKKVDISELDSAEKEIIEQAKKATFDSYSPYSNFKVGAAVLLGNGEVVTGSNQENCAYPSGLCAERTAIFYANSKYPRSAIDTLCIAARDENNTFTKHPVTPCGSCRQVLIESERRFNSKIKIILYGTDYILIVSSAESLLPLSFNL